MLERGLAGSRPGGRPSFFCVAKRKRAKKRRARCLSPAAWRSGQPAVLASGGVRANSLRSNKRGPSSASRCAPRLRHRAVEGARKAALPSVFATPCGRAEQRSARRIQKAACLSAASLLPSRRVRAAQVAPLLAATGSLTRGRLFFAFFLLAKQKKEGHPPGRDPAKPLPHGRNQPSAGERALSTATTKGKKGKCFS